MQRHVPTKRKFLFMMMLLISIVVLSACSKGTTTDTPTTNDTNAPSTNGSSSNGTSEPDVPREEPVETKSSTGTFVGLADNHTVEITIEGNAEAFQFGEQLQMDMDKLKENDPVQIEYTEESVEGDDPVSVRTLTSITKLA